MLAQREDGMTRARAGRKLAAAGAAAAVLAALCWRRRLRPFKFSTPRLLPPQREHAEVSQSSIFVLSLAKPFAIDSALDAASAEAARCGIALRGCVVGGVGVYLAV